GAEPHGAGADGVRASQLASAQWVAQRAGMPTLAGGVGVVRLSGAAGQAQAASLGPRQPGAIERAGGSWLGALRDGSGARACGVGDRRDAWRAGAVPRV